MESAQLYEKAMTDLVPPYVEENYDTIDTNTIHKHIVYLA
jgi:hypothetical protein